MVWTLAQELGREPYEEVCFSREAKRGTLGQGWGLFPLQWESRLPAMGFSGSFEDVGRPRKSHCGERGQQVS